MRVSSDLEGMSSKLDWKEFENFARLAFESAGFEVRQNFRLKKPTCEIDLVAFRGNSLAFAVDCKHWKRTVGYSTMLNIGSKQMERANRLTVSFKNVIPMVLTLHDEMLRVLENGVPVVPISTLSDFLLNWENPENCVAVLKGTRVEKQLRL